MDNIIGIVIGAFGTFLTALVTWGAQRLIAFLNNKIKNERAEECLRCAIGVIESVVKQTQQTYVDGIKGTEAWNKEAQSKALSEAVNKADELLSPGVKKYIFATYGSVAAWLTNEIEAKIYELKKSK